MIFLSYMNRLSQVLCQKVTSRILRNYQDMGLQAFLNWMIIFSEVVGMEFIKLTQAKILNLKQLFSNKLMSDIHGIHVTKGYIISVLTCKDTVVFTDFEEGNIINHFTINKNLKIIKNKKLEKIDWRFISQALRRIYWFFFHFNSCLSKK